jgi:hypothetical protein
MPNYCSNTLTVYAKGDSLSRAKELVFKDDQFTFSAAVPMPEELVSTSSPNNIITEKERKDLIKKGLPLQVTYGAGTDFVFTKNLFTESMIKDLESKYGASNWYDWRKNNWGCKWDANPEDSFITHREDGFTVDFVTPWCPPDNWFASVCEMLSNEGITAELEYSESGCGFAGKFIFAFGEFDHQDGTIVMVDESTDLEVTYDNDLESWTNEDGEPVCDDRVVERVIF